MPADQLLLAFCAALAGTVLATPVAIWLARRTGFLDHPVGYKGHASATPYLGGLALGAGILIPAIAYGGATTRFGVLALGAGVLWLVGTVDDRVNLPPLTRVIVEVAAAILLWLGGIGWEVPGAEPLGFALSVLWVVALVNAYNLMDNMDGAAGTVGCISAAGLAAMAIVAGDPLLASLALAVCGSCAGFLWFNLASPARIFLGDGGSMPLGFLIAGMAMAAPVGGELGVLSLVAIAPVAGLPILDTCLVMISRRRRGTTLLTGGRDHLTHRLRRRLHTPAAVAVALAGAQVALCGMAVVVAQLDPGAVAGVGVACLAGAALAIWVLERPGLAPPLHATAEAPLTMLPAGSGSLVTAAHDQPVTALVSAAQKQSSI